MKFILPDNYRSELNRSIFNIRKMKGMPRKLTLRTENLAWDSRRGPYIKKKHGELKRKT